MFAFLSSLFSGAASSDSTMLDTSLRVKLLDLKLAVMAHKRSIELAQHTRTADIKKYFQKAKEASTRGEKQVAREALSMVISLKKANSKDTLKCLRYDKLVTRMQNTAIEPHVKQRIIDRVNALVTASNSKLKPIRIKSMEVQRHIHQLKTSAETIEDMLDSLEEDEEEEMESIEDEKEQNAEVEMLLDQITDESTLDELMDTISIPQQQQQPASSSSSSVDVKSINNTA